MRVYYSTDEAEQYVKKGAAVAIGNYDGVHSGHRTIIKNLIKKAKARHYKPLLLTFDPHPAKILAPDVAPPLINTHSQKVELLTQTGLDAVIFQKFNKQFAKTRPEAFFKNNLLHDLHAKYIAVGYDFTFGAHRSGTIETLEILAYQNQVELSIVPAKMLSETLISSSTVRKLVMEGNLRFAQKMLTRPFFIDGTVIKGYNRGESLGIHTANLKTDNELIPGDGVYATWIDIDSKLHKSVTNIGKNPTFDNPERSIETHIFNFQDNILGEKIRLIFADKIREEIKFPRPTELARQIQEDISHAQKILKHFHFKLK